MKIEFHVYVKAMDRCFVITKYTDKMTLLEAKEFADKACNRIKAKDSGNKAAYIIDGVIKNGKME